MSGRRLLIPPAIRSALGYLQHCEETIAPVTGGEPEQILQDGRKLTPREKDTRDAALELLASYFRDAETRSALDATTLPVMSECEAVAIGFELDDDLQEAIEGEGED